MSASFLTDLAQVKPREDYDSPSALQTAMVIEQAGFDAHGKACVNFAPTIAIRKDAGYWTLVQGCCNDWNCPRCGFLRAKREYGRIIEGARELARQGYALHFLTLTCRGRELSLAEADDKYMLWTNRLLTTLRKDAKKREWAWCYVQVTERQERGHAHSHLITTYRPEDAKLYRTGQYMPGGRRARKGSMHSFYLIARAVDAGLGKETDLTLIDKPEAVAVYVSKYLFKDAQTTVFPKGWRRVRYSQNFPQLPEREVEAFPVITGRDWRRVATLLEPVLTRDPEVLKVSLLQRVFNVLLVDNSAKQN